MTSHAERTVMSKFLSLKSIGLPFGQCMIVIRQGSDFVTKEVKNLLLKDLSSLVYLV